MIRVKPRILGLLAATALGASHHHVRAAQKSIVSHAGQPSPVNLDVRRLNALGLIETGNNDRAIGKAGEVSRYQLTPKVWSAYTATRDYQNTESAIRVAQKHWKMLAAYFQIKSGHAPTDFDMYVLWNTRFGYYERRSFSTGRLSPIVRDRAQRFVNLVNRNG
jgi:hypothetical protein